MFPTPGNNQQVSSIDYTSSLSTNSAQTDPGRFDQATTIGSTNNSGLDMRDVTSNDILMNKGRRFSKHSGNQRLRHLVETQVFDYMRAPSADKGLLIKQNLATLAQTHPPSRFLKFDKTTNRFIMVSEEIAAGKLEREFRNAISRQQHNETTAGITAQHSKSMRRPDARAYEPESAQAPTINHFYVAGDAYFLSTPNIGILDTSLQNSPSDIDPLPFEPDIDAPDTGLWASYGLEPYRFPSHAVSENSDDILNQKPAAITNRSVSPPVRPNIFDEPLPANSQQTWLSSNTLPLSAVRSAEQPDSSSVARMPHVPEHMPVLPTSNDAENYRDQSPVSPTRSDRTVTRGSWSRQEDETLKQAMGGQTEDFNDWALLKDRLPGRMSKQIRDRWVNHLRPGLVHGKMNDEELDLIAEAVTLVGKKWVTISSTFFASTRSENQIKNAYYSSRYRDYMANKKQEIAANSYEPKTTVTGLSQDTLISTQQSTVTMTGTFTATAKDPETTIPVLPASSDYAYLDDEPKNITAV